MYLSMKKYEENVFKFSNCFHKHFFLERTFFYGKRIACR